MHVHTPFRIYQERFFIGEFMAHALATAGRFCPLTLVFQLYIRNVRNTFDLQLLTYFRIPVTGIKHFTALLSAATRWCSCCVNASTDASSVFQIPVS